MTTFSARLMTNLQNVKQRLAKAAVKAQRDPAAIKLVIVTKTVPAWVLNQLLEAGYNCFGENKAQELLAKNKCLKSQPEWHFIGRLQQNKVKKVVGLVDLIQSVAKLELAEEIAKQAAKIGKEQKVLLQVNAASDPAKAGVELNECPLLVAKIAKLRHIKVVGLMTIGRLASNPEVNRPAFAALKKVYDKLALEYEDFTWLSMGMSQDFEVAVEEGANMVRIGSAIFGR